MEKNLVVSSVFCVNPRVIQKFLLSAHGIDNLHQQFFQQYLRKSEKLKKKTIPNKKRSICLSHRKLFVFFFCWFSSQHQKRHIKKNVKKFQKNIGVQISLNAGKRQKLIFRRRQSKISHNSCAFETSKQSQIVRFLKYEKKNQRNHFILLNQ